jgi:hypothetical protein
MDCADNKRLLNPPLPSSRIVHGIPTYALGGHTRLGKQAIRVWVERSLKDSFRKLVAPAQWQAAAELAVFHVESALVAPAVEWDQGTKLRREAVEADFHAIETRPEIIPEILGVAGERLLELDDIRAALIEGKARNPASSQVTGA